MMSRSVVVQEDPGLARRRRWLLMLGMLGLFFLGLGIGGYGSLQLGIKNAAENRQLRETIVTQARQLEELRQWKIDNLTRAEIDKAALELVRLELATQQETIDELDKGVHFYRSLMAPDEVVEGLSVRSVDIKPGSDAGRYQFRILVQQSSRKHELLTGTLKVKVLGLLDGEPVDYDLSDLSDQIPSTDIRLRFKYFQAIDGELALPEGFIPQSVGASARSTKPKRAEVDEQFPWPTKEKTSYVGQ